MHVELNRKKLLCISFFLCCVLPAVFVWFQTDNRTINGTHLMVWPLLVGISLYAMALLFDRLKNVLSLGITAHGILLAGYINSLLWMPHLTDCDGISGSISAAKPMFWISLGLLLVHVTIFTTTEVLMQRISKEQKKHK